MRRRFNVIWVILAVSALTGAVDLAWAEPEESHPGISLEADYSEAVFEFTNKRYAETVKILDELLKKKPDHIQALEMKALSLKTLGDEASSVSVYTSLLKYKPEKERAPYYFELGTILYRQKKYAEARPHLLKAAAAKFNRGVSYFFVGTMDFQTGASKSAQIYFKRALSEVPDDLKVACHYYLGVINAQRGYSAGATQELSLAKEGADQITGSDMVRDLGIAASKALEPYDKSVWFGTLSLSGQYDGNVASLSSSVAPEDATGKKSAKANFAFTGGYMGSPMRTIQTIAMYRFNLNKNLNSFARDYEFATNTLSGFFTLDPLMTTSYGMKVEGNYGFQDRQDAATRSYAFRPYNYSGEAGPFVKTDLSEMAHLSLEVNYRYQSFYADGTGVNQRSGGVITPRAGMRWDTAWAWLNPSATATYEINQALGDDQRSRTMVLDFSNSLKVRANETVSMGVTLSLTRYPVRTEGVRSDKTISARAGWQKPIDAKLSVSADASYTVNISNIPDVYSYNKPTFSVGVNYSL